MNVGDLALALNVGAARGARALARAVRGERQRVLALGESIARALAQAGHEPLRVGLEHGRLAVEDAAADALCASGLPDVTAAPLVVRECARAVRNGGSVIFATAAGIVGRGPDRTVVTAAFMHAGLIDIQQHLSRGTAITVGRVRR